VDSCGWIEYLSDLPNADFFAPALEDASKLLVPTICLYEVFKAFTIQRGEKNALRAIAVMNQGEIIDLTPPISLSAAKLSIEQRLPMADGIVLATARLHDAVIWTQDKDFEGIEGVKFIKRRSAR
jgi:predicted nucleic acid-binding protein